jgi:hypothetical protein
MKLEMLDEVDPDLGGEVAGGAAHQLPVDLRLQRQLLPLTRLEGVLQSDRGHSLIFLHGSGINIPNSRSNNNTKEEGRSKLVALFFLPKNFTILKKSDSPNKELDYF